MRTHWGAGIGKEQRVQHWSLQSLHLPLKQVTQTKFLLNAFQCLYSAVWLCVRGFVCVLCFHRGGSVLCISTDKAHVLNVTTRRVEWINIHNSLYACCLKSLSVCALCTMVTCCDPGNFDLHPVCSSNTLTEALEHMQDLSIWVLVTHTLRHTHSWK